MKQSKQLEAVKGNSFVNYSVSYKLVTILLVGDVLAKITQHLILHRIKTETSVWILTLCAYWQYALAVYLIPITHNNGSKNRKKESYSY